MCEIKCQRTLQGNDYQISVGHEVSVTGKQLVVILITAVAAITICSKSSPIYPFNDWVDSNCFMTVGKSMLRGVVPYRDLYEQKGPLLYMLHALTAMVSDTTFIGVYFLEIYAAASFLFYGYKLMKIYQQSVSILLIPILAAVVYSAESFYYGDSAEELCLPFFSYAIYLAARSIKKGKLPTWLEYLAVGVTSAFVLWIKYSLLGLYIGWFFVIAWQLMRNRDAKKLIYAIFWIGVGVCITTIPILLYFGMNHALSDLWTVYFYNNLFSYSTGFNNPFFLALPKNLLDGIRNVLYQSPFSAIMIGIGLLTLAKKKDKMELYAYLIMGILTFLLVYGGGRHFRYYAFIFSSFVPIGILAVYKILWFHFLDKYRKVRANSFYFRFAPWIICVGSLVFTFVMCNNTYMLHYNKSDLPQYQFAEIISQKEDATLLNYGFLDGGFYTTTGIIPNCKFFCQLNIQLDEIMEMQDEYVQEGWVDYVVTRQKELESDRYNCIARSDCYYDNTKYEYFLYQLIP